MSDIHVRKRGEKWYYSFEAASIDGKRKRIERVGGKTKKEALEKGIQALSEYNNSGQHFEPASVSVADFLDYYMDNYCKINNKYNTQVGNISAIEKHLKPAFGVYKLSSLGTAAIQEFVNDKFVSGNFAKSTLENIIAPLSQAFEYAIDLGYVKDNPCRRIKYPKNCRTAKTREVITVNEYNEIMEELDKHKPFNISVMIGWYAGLRISETFGLTWNDIDFDNKTITVNKQIVKRNFGVDVRKAFKEKGKKEERSAWYFQSPKTPTSNRTIVVSDDLIRVLRAYRKEQLEHKIYYGEYYRELYLKEETDEKGKPIQRVIEIEKSIPCTLPTADMIFRKENGGYISTDSFKYAARIIHHKLGMDKFDYHSLRHTHATMLIEAGVSPKTVQERLGHASIQTTFDKYVHNTKDMEHEAVDAFDTALKAKAK
ncbi:MAG: site-specific integrase [Lachnospiraceae bacterium]|nr:site-specific integrase [Lachnospiraceae bacterium]